MGIFPHCKFQSIQISSIKHMKIIILPSIWYPKSIIITNEVILIGCQSRLSIWLFSYDKFIIPPVKYKIFRCVKNSVVTKSCFRTKIPKDLFQLLFTNIKKPWEFIWDLYSASTIPLSLRSPCDRSSEVWWSYVLQN